MFPHTEKETREPSPCFHRKSPGFPISYKLAAGYHADFIFLNQDILEITPEKIDEIVVEATYMGGTLL